jgi:hypothetical protein
VLEAIIRGCPVISYGFGYGHVRVSNHALERFGLAQVATAPAELGPAIGHALSQQLEPNASFAQRPSSAAVILSSTRRAEPLPRWRVRSVRAATRAIASATAVGAVFLTSVAYGLVADLGGPGPLKSVNTRAAQVAVMVDASSGREAVALARALTRWDIHVSFALPSGSASAAERLFDFRDDLVPELHDSGLVGWFGTSGKLRRLERELGLHQIQHRYGWGKHFLYTSSGPSLLQVMFGNSTGGKLVAGRVKIRRAGQIPHVLRKGEIIEVEIRDPAAIRRELLDLARALHRSHLAPATVGGVVAGPGTPI